MKPLDNDERFKHVSYHETNLRLTFARVKREQAKAAAKAAAVATKVTTLQRKVAK